MEKKLWQARQGDVFVIESVIPKTAIKQPKESRIVLEHGEVTGHAHAIPAKEGFDLLLDGTRKYLELCLAAPLTHEEHSKIVLPKGTYEVRRQCTWSSLQQMSLLVAD